MNKEQVKVDSLCAALFVCAVAGVVACVLAYLVGNHHGWAARDQETQKELVGQRLGEWRFDAKTGKAEFIDLRLPKIEDLQAKLDRLQREADRFSAYSGR